MTGWGRVLAGMGHEFFFWNPESRVAFDAFDDLKPDLFLGTTFDLDSATIKCIKQRPELRVGLYASAWGPMVNELDLKQYPIVAINDEEKKKLEKLKQETGRPDFVHLHLTPNFLEPILGGWRDIGIKPLGILNAADTFAYLDGEVKEEYKTDIAFIGGYWGYKGRNLNRYLLPLLHPDHPAKLSAKIWGNQPWPCLQYLGLINDDQAKHAWKSAKICPNVSEPHSTDYGFDMVERPFKVAAAGGFCISDYVESTRELFGEVFPMAKTPREFADLIEHYLKDEAARSFQATRQRLAVLGQHTYFHRIDQMFTHGLDMPWEAKKCRELYSKVMSSPTSSESSSD
jgi:hypothetical protein